MSCTRPTNDFPGIEDQRNGNSCVPYSRTMASRQIANANTVVRRCSLAENFNVVAAPVNCDGVPALDVAVAAAEAAADTAPLELIVNVVVYVLVTGEVGRTSVAPPLVKSEPYKVVVLLSPTGMMMVI